MSKRLKIKQTRSAINRHESQKRTIRALGILRLQHEVVQPDNPQIRGMINKIQHLVQVEEID